MLDIMICRRSDIRTNLSVHLADGQAWPLPDRAATIHPAHVYEALLDSIVAADDQNDMLRAELALGIYLIVSNYDLPPLILNALLEFPQNDPELTRLQTELHTLAMEHIRAYRRSSDASIPPFHDPLIARRFGIFGRVRALMTT